MLNRITERFDFLIILPLILLLSFSFIVIYSSEPEFARQQLVFAGVGLVIFFFLSLIDYSILQKISPLIFVALVVVLASVNLFGEEVRGSTRWLDLGSFRFQPSEFAKVALIIVLADFFRRVLPSIPRLKELLFSAVIVGLPATLVFLQPDLGTALSFMAIWGGFVLVSGVPISYILTLATVFILSMPVAWNYLKDYQRDRIFVFLNPYSDPLGAGYNVLQAVIAVGSGKMWGRGFGRGTQSHLRFLPEQHTDFIFASLAEEWGFLGAFLLLLFFFTLISRLFYVSYRAENAFGMLLSFGTGVLFLSQVLVNIGMNLGLMPVTGIPLPFVSYGGSSLMAYMILLGLAHNVAINNKT